MKEILFNPNGAALKVRLEFYGLIVAAYAMKLSEKNSSRHILYKTGTNKNPGNNLFEIPGPASRNDGRILRLSTEFYGLDPVNFRDYNIVISIYQGDLFLSDHNEQGSITETVRKSLLFVKLVAGIPNPDG